MVEGLRQSWDLLTPEQRRAVLPLILWMFVGMCLETLGISMVIPALTVITQPDLASRLSFVAELQRVLGDPTREQMVVIGMLLMALVYVLKAGFLAWATARQFRFVYDIQASLSLRLFSVYLRKPYTFHLERNSAQLIRNVINATNEFTTTGLVSLLILITESMVLVGIGLLLLYVEALGVMTAAVVLGLVGWVFNRATRRGVQRAGEALHRHEELRIRTLQQAIGAAKELKLLHRETQVIEQYTPHNSASARIGCRHATLVALPKLWLELLAIIGLVLVVIAMIWQGRSTAELVPTLGLFAAATFRLIPTSSRILGSIQFIRYSLPVVRMLHEELAVAAAADHRRAEGGMGIDGDLSFDGVVVRYPGSHRPAIAGIDLHIERGSTVGIIGGSGAGKSTLVDAFLGLLPLESGTIRAGGTDIRSDLRAWQSQIGYVPQTIYLVDDSIRNNIALGLSGAEIDAAAVARAVTAAQLDDFIEELPQGLDSIVGERGVRLSGGQRQRIGIARALYNDPAILVLDEATSALDAETERGLMTAIDALHGSKTILIVTHRMSTLAWCDQIATLASGRVKSVVPAGPRAADGNSADLAGHAAGEMPPVVPGEGPR